MKVKFETQGTWWVRVCGWGGGGGGGGGGHQTDEGAKNHFDDLEVEPPSCNVYRLPRTAHQHPGHGSTGVLTEGLTTVEKIGAAAQTITSRGTTNTYLSIVVIPHVGCTVNDHIKRRYAYKIQLEMRCWGVVNAGVAGVRPTAPRATIQISKMVAASPAASKLSQEFAARQCAG
jgi:hypothetical protein